MTIRIRKSVDFVSDIRNFEWRLPVKKIRITTLSVFGKINEKLHSVPYHAFYVTAPNTFISTEEENNI